MIEVVDSTNTRLILGATTPGFSPSSIAVGDTLDIDFAFLSESDGTYSKYTLRLRIERAGKLLVAVGANDPAGLSFEEGEHECFRDLDFCAEEDIAMQMEDAQGNVVSIPNGTSAEVDGLLVMNAVYLQNYNQLGNCNFSTPVEYLVSAVPIP